MKPALLLCLALCLVAFSPRPSLGASTCYGTPGHGKLSGGVKLPPSGPNFVSYGTLPALIGRTYIHSKVRDVIVTAFKDLEKTSAGVVFKYAEAGKQSGGPFPPHKTHQNGLSLDIMVPVMTADGTPAELSTTILNRYGYDHEFDTAGRMGALTIDFDALGDMILAIDRAARDHGVRMRRVLFAPDLQPELYASKHGQVIRQTVKIPNKRSWVRHDEHIHVDFDVPCRPMG